MAQAGATMHRLLGNGPWNATKVQRGCARVFTVVPMGSGAWRPFLPDTTQPAPWLDNWFSHQRSRVPDGGGREMAPTWDDEPLSEDEQAPIARAFGGSPTTWVRVAVNRRIRRFYAVRTLTQGAQDDGLDLSLFGATSIRLRAAWGVRATFIQEHPTNAVASRAARIPEACTGIRWRHKTVRGGADFEFVSEDDYVQHPLFTEPVLALAIPPDSGGSGTLVRRRRILTAAHVVLRTNSNGDITSNTLLSSLITEGEGMLVEMGIPRQPDQLNVRQNGVIARSVDWDTRVLGVGGNTRHKYDWAAIRTTTAPLPVRVETMPLSQACTSSIRTRAPRNRGYPAVGRGRYHRDLKCNPNTSVRLYLAQFVARAPAFDRISRKRLDVHITSCVGMSGGPMTVVRNQRPFAAGCVAGGSDEGDAMSRTRGPRARYFFEDFHDG
jgi:hypothetical protein